MNNQHDILSTFAIALITFLIVILIVVFYVDHHKGIQSIEEAVIINKYWEAPKDKLFYAAPQSFWCKFRSTKPDTIKRIFFTYKNGITFDIQFREKEWRNLNVGDTLKFGDR